ncbi:hypothetical protein MaudCBS49596_002708 [Microsporum audouinii]
MPSNIAKKETAEERRLRIKKALEDVKKMSQRELRADLEKHGFTVIGKGIPYDTDEDIVACFNSYGTIIDSSARQLLKVKDQKPASAFKGMWALNNLASPDPILSFKPTGSKNFTQFNSLSNYIDAIYRCLLQLCDQDSFILRKPITSSDLTAGLQGSQRIVDLAGVAISTIKQLGPSRFTNKQSSFHITEMKILFRSILDFCNDRARVEQYKEIKHFVSEIWETSINELGGGTFIERWIAS